MTRKTTTFSTSYIYYTAYVVPFSRYSKLFVENCRL